MLADLRDRPDPLVDDEQELVVVLRDHLRHQVERARGGDHVVDFLHRGQRLGDRLDVTLAPNADHRLPVEADGERVGDRHHLHHLGVSSRCTRWRTAASDRPTALAIVA